MHERGPLRAQWDAIAGECSAEGKSEQAVDTDLLKQKED